MGKLSNTEILFIRACKSENRIRRLLSVYRRFYGDYGRDVAINSLTYKLAEICDKVTPISSTEFLVLYGRQCSYYMHEQLPTTNELMFNIFMSRLTFTKNLDLLQYGYKPKFKEL